MQSISTIGLDIAKSVFQVHGVDAAGQVVIRRQLRRRHVLAFFQKLPPCLVGIEACASSHHWSRARIAAIRELLDRGYGRPRQAMEVSIPTDDPIRMLLDELDARSRVAPPVSQDPNRDHLPLGFNRAE